MALRSERLDMDIVTAFEYWVNSNENKLMFGWLDKHANVVNSFTRKQLNQYSKNLAYMLKEKHGIRPGDRIMIVYPFGIDFVVSMLACWRIGVVVVSVYPPNPRKLAVDIEKFTHFVQDCSAKVALTTSTFKRVVQASKMTHRNWPKGLKWIATDSYSSSNEVPSGWNQWHEIQLEELALIQYTSGSTGNPKGIMISFSNLTHQISYSIRMGQKMDPELRDSFEGSVCVSWAPQYHDMGLIITYLLPLFSGGTAYGMSPLTFLADPPIWPRAMAKYKATFSNGPYFALALTCKRIAANPEKYSKFDCSRVRSIILGAEPSEISILPGVEKYMGVPAESIAHSYGQAENVVGITIRGAQTLYDDGLWAVGGIKDALRHGDTTVVIADVIEPASDSQTENHIFDQLLDGQEGEIWCTGPSVAMGYWERPILTSNVFHAKLNQKPEMDFLRTGDLGFIRDGQLFITARLKDLIIIRGRNVAPSDIERAAETHFTQDVRPGCSIAFQSSPETILLMCELREVSKDHGFLNSLAQDIKQYAQKTFDVELGKVILLQKGSNPKTTSGKIQRSKGKKMWETQDPNLRVIWGLETTLMIRQPKESDDPAPHLFSEDAGLWLSRQLSLILNTDEVDWDAELVSLGLSSMGTVQFVKDMETLSGSVLDVDFIGESSSVNSLITSLRELPAESRRMVPDVMLTKLKEKKSWKAPFLFLFQFIGIMVIWTMAMGAVLPSYYFGNWLIYDFNMVPWSYFNIGNSQMFGLLMPLFIPMWMISFTTLVCLSKWIVIGRYKEQKFAMYTFAFLRWWWVDRLLSVWESFVGYFIRETKFLNLIYRLFGSNVSMSASLDSFYRDFDLISVGSSAHIKGMVMARMFNAETQTLRFRKVFIGQTAKIDSESFVMPGCKVASGSWLKPLSVLVEGAITRPNTVYLRNPACEDGLTTPCANSNSWFARWCMEAGLMMLITYIVFFLSAPFVLLWERQFPESRYSNFFFWTTIPTLNSLLAIPLAVCFKWLLLGKVKPGMQSTFLFRRARDFFVDYQFRVLILMAFRIVDDYSYSTVLWVKSYGGQLDLTTGFVPMPSLRPSKVDLLGTKTGSFCSNAVFQFNSMGSNEYQSITIGERGQVGLRAVIGASINEGASVGPCTFFSKGRVLKPNTRVMGSTKLLHVHSDQPEQNTSPSKLPQTWVLSLLASISLRSLLFLSFIGCLIPSYEIANWLLFESTLSREISIPLLSISVLAAFLVLAIWGGLLTRIILGFGYSENGYNCGMRMYILTHAINNTNQELLMPVFHGTAFMNWFCYLMGSKVGKNAYIASNSILEHHLLEFGADSIVDEGVYVTGHLQVYNTLELKQVVIKPKATLHSCSLAMCGATAAGEILPRTYVPEDQSSKQELVAELIL